ncbi:putative elongation factor 1-alpha-like 3, partial [Galemys pyrenaicus]
PAQRPQGQKKGEEASRAVSSCIKRIGPRCSTVAFVPISEWTGDNVPEPGADMPWSEGWKITRDGGEAGGTDGGWWGEKASTPSAGICTHRAWLHDSLLTGCVLATLDRRLPPTGPAGQPCARPPDACSNAVKSVELHHEASSEAPSGMMQAPVPKTRLRKMFVGAVWLVTPKMTHHWKELASVLQCYSGAGYLSAGVPCGGFSRNPHRLRVSRRWIIVLGNFGGGPEILEMCSCCCRCYGSSAVAMVSSRQWTRRQREQARSHSLPGELRKLIGHCPKTCHP